VITMNCRNFDPHRVVKYRDLNFPKLNLWSGIFTLALIS